MPPQALSAQEMQADVEGILVAQERLAVFSEYVSGGWYVAHAVHHQIAYELEQVMRFLETGGEEGTQFLAIQAPPQHGKSAMTSQFFPAWGLGRMPNLRITMTSYGDALATKNSRYTRNIILSDRYRAVFGDKSPVPGDEQVILSQDSRSVSAWDLAAPNRGGVVATGVGGAVTGQPKGLHIIDDPIKDHREAQNQNMRDDVWEFYKSALRVRAIAIVLMMTHWHPDDPLGRILKKMIEREDSDQWRVLDLPALIEPGLFAANIEEQRKYMSGGVYKELRDPLGREMGEVLCAPMWSKGELLKIRANDDYYFSALYQQRPYPKDGQAYKREWFKIISKLPDGVTLKYVVRFWDKSNPGKKKGDYTAGALMAYGSDGYFYLLDMVRGRWGSAERNRRMQKTARRDREQYGKVYIWHQQDPGSAGKDSAENTNQVLMGFNAKFQTLSGDKEDRSDPLEDLLGRVERLQESDEGERLTEQSEVQESALQGGLMFLLQGAWNDAFIEECVAFPGGTFDDQVDAASSAYNKLLEIIGKKRKSKVQ